MSNLLERGGGITRERLAAIDQLLITGTKQGPANRKEAINKILEFVPQWRRLDCWQRIRYLRKTSQLAALPTEHAHTDADRKDRQARQVPPTPWTSADDDKLLNLAGYEPVRKIAERLGRSERAVRFRLAALGMSAKVTDGFSQRALQKMLRVRSSRLRHLIGSGMLRVRDPRISALSLAVFCDKIRPSLGNSAADAIATALVDEGDAYSWERVASLLGVPRAQVQAWIATGQLRVVDPFVTDRAFEEFCKKHGHELETALIDPPIAKWLLTEYGASELATKTGVVSRSQKHALVVRACPCGRKIAGNAYFRHVKRCSSSAGTAN
jgi:hypothetical protein